MGYYNYTGRLGEGCYNYKDYECYNYTARLADELIIRVAWSMGIYYTGRLVDGYYTGRLVDEYYNYTDRLGDGYVIIRVAWSMGIIRVIW